MILEKIKENALKFPERTAIVEQSNQTETILSWKELDEYSDKLAYFLLNNYSEDSPIIVYGHKSPYMIVCFLACVKVGRAYCPIDVNVPLSRTKAIIDDVKPEVVFNTETLNIENENMINLDEIKRIINVSRTLESKDSYIKEQDSFYIIFTSGSTGTPKGVQITLDCLDNFVKWAITLIDRLDPNKRYTFINQAPFSFDLSVMDLYLSLYTGGTLWCLSKEIQLDSIKLYQSLKKSEANVWVSTPSFADVCLADPVFAKELMPQLSEFIFCGEVLTNRTVERLNKKFPDSNIVNTYGPTESTCAISSVRITPELNKNVSPLPVGVAKKGTWIYIIDESGKEAKEGDCGEIIIVGDTVSTGYWKNIERNEKAFDRWEINGTFYRCYKTGDKGYLLDGMLYYCGRIDLQIKLHGYRIELEDIECNLLKLDGISQAVVIPKYREGKVSSLIAGVVTNYNVVDTAEENRKIKDLLKATLPEYMVPKKIKFLTDIPMTNNGKVDRMKLGGLL